MQSHDAQAEPFVSVIIPTYNRARYLAEAIESVLAQTYTAREVIVVDDGSTDDTEEVAGKFGDSILYHRQENAERSAARNTGFRLSRGSLIAFLDSDDLWLPSKLAEDVRSLQEHADVGLVYTNYSIVDAGGRHIKDVDARSHHGRATDLVLSEGLASIGTHLIRREHIEAIGGFKEVRNLAEDWEFWVRLSLVTAFKHNAVRTAKIRTHAGNTMNDAIAMHRGQIAALACFEEMVVAGKISRRAFRAAKAQVELVSAINYTGARELGTAVRQLAEAARTRPALLADPRMAYTAYRILRFLPSAVVRSLP